MNLSKILRLLTHIFIGGLVFLVYCHLETRWIKTKHITIHSKDVPDEFQFKRFVFISDIHHGPYLSIFRVEKLVTRINSLEPDFLLMGGDYVHRESLYIKPVFDELFKLKKDIDVYAVLGNHDHWEDAEITKDMMVRNQISICDNESFWIRTENDSIKIGGVGDLWEDDQILENVTSDLNGSDFCILISHNPDYIEYIKSDLIDLTLSGHTHGGQMTLFGLWAPILPSRYGQKYRYGLIKNGNLQSYITSGIGTITPPLRFFCRPEIVVINLKK